MARHLQWRGTQQVHAVNGLKKMQGDTHMSPTPMITEGKLRPCYSQLFIKVRQFPRICMKWNWDQEQKY
jgi:hypothetical protein